MFKVGRDPVHLGLGFLDLDPVGQPGHHTQIPGASALRAVLPDSERRIAQRKPQVGLEGRTGEVAGKNTDHGEGLSAQLNGPANDTRVTAVSIAPKRLAQEDDAAPAGDGELGG